MRSMGFDLAIAPLTCSHCCCKPHEAQFYSRTRQLLVATSDHAHGSIGNPRAARRSDQECEVRFIDARQREGPRVASEAASPLGLTGTNGVSTSVELPFAVPVVSHTRVPLTMVTLSGVPIEFPPARTKPCTWNCNRPVAKSTSALPLAVVHG